MKRRRLLQFLAVAPWLAPALAQQTGGIKVFGNLPAPDKITRVFAAGPPAAVLTYVLAPNKLLGWPQQMDGEVRRFLAPAYRELPFLGRLSGRGSTIPLETLLSLKPDLILDVGTADGTSLSVAQRVSRQTGIPCVLVPGHFSDSPRQLREVGRLLGVTHRADQLAGYAENTLSASVAADKGPRIYFGRGVDGLETGLEGSINMEVIDRVGNNVARAAGKGSLTRVSLEQILAWNPEVIMTQNRNFARRALSDPSWRAIAAVRAGRVYRAPILPFGWLDGPPSVNRLIGLRWLLWRLHPLAHPLGKGDLRRATSEFYRLFYGTDLAKGALDELLGGE